MITQADQHDLTALIRDYLAHSSGMRFEDKRRFWDDQEPSPVLKPEEEPIPLVGWTVINDYWQRTRSDLESLESTQRGLQFVELDQDTVLALYHMTWSAVVNGPFLRGSPLVAHVRVTMALRRKPDGWRIFAVVESHVDGEVFLRQLYKARK